MIGSATLSSAVLLACSRSTGPEHADIPEPPELYPVIQIPAGKMQYDVPVSSYTGVEYLTVPITIKKPYKIGKYEVTVALWNMYIEDGWGEKRPELKNPAIQNHPMVKVTWHDAYRFAQWLSAKTGKHYRLPTEHEWFYAANEGKYRREQAQTYDYSNLEEIKRTPKITYPAGHFGANSWGMYDYAGNVWEWTLGAYALAEETLKKPQDPAILNDPHYTATRITGGEHRAHVPDFISDTYNGGCATLKPAANLGFRLVLEDEQEK
jgi:formylglycine-generating enzyme required for sulfatase activity